MYTLPLSEYFHDLLWLDLLARVVVGAVLGALIGLERQLRAKSAGIRTNALVSLGSSLFVIMGTYAFLSFDGHADPARVAAQVVSGIGFLGAGVIMKQRGSISGINTAATLWSSASVGMLAGAGLFPIAAIGAGMIILTNSLLRPISRALDGRKSKGSHESVATLYNFEVRCARQDEVNVRAIVFNAVHRPGFLVRSIAANDLPDDMVVITATVETPQRNDVEVEFALVAIVPVPEVLGVRWTSEQVESSD